jgi:hypothetical protein
MVAVMTIASAKNDIKIFVRNTVAEIGRQGHANSAGEIPDPRQSSFGRWYEGAAREHFGQLAAFQQIAGPHAALYLGARGVHAAAEAGDREEALRQASEMPRLEQELIEKLDELMAAIGQSQN